MTSTLTRVFVARLAGIAVFDPAGDQIGRVRDVVVSLPLGATPPRVHGLVVEVQPRRRVFLPITRVTSIDTGAVIFTGRLNMRRFEQRASETLAIGELLDRTVRLKDSEESVTVLDLAMEQLRPPDWVLSKVAVRRGGRGLRRRRGETMIVDWGQAIGFGEKEEGQGATNLLAAFEAMRPADLASVLHALSAKRRSEVAAALDDERLADILEELPEDDQVEILGKLDISRAADVLEVMGCDDAADLLAELPADQAERLLELMEPEEAAPVRRLMKYSDDSAGGLMDSEPVILPPDATVAEALARIRNRDLAPAMAAQLYVCRPPTETPTGRYLGIAHFQRLLREPPSTLIGAVMDTDIDPIYPDLSLQEVTSYLATYNMVAVPVVDDDGRLLGAVTVDDVLDHLLPADWREHGHVEADRMSVAEGGARHGGRDA